MKVRWIIKEIAICPFLFGNDLTLRLLPWYLWDLGEQR